MTSSWKAPRVPEPSSRVTTVMGLSGPPRFPHRVRSPEKICFDFGDLETADGVRGVDDDGQAVAGDDDLIEVLLVPLELARGHADPAGAALAGLDAGARAAALDVDAEVGVAGHEDLGPPVREGLDARRAGQGQVVPGAAAAAAGEKGDAEGEEAEGEPSALHVGSG